MADPQTTPFITFAISAGVALLTETVKFVYSQATELLKARRDRKQAGGSEPGHEPQITAVTPKELPDIFEGRLEPLQVDFEALEREAERINALRKEIDDYAQGIEVIDPKNRDLVAKVDDLRGLLEVVYSQRITFKGEQREPSGTRVHGS